MGTDDVKTIETLDDAKRWIYEHDGRIGAWWEGQRAHNARVEERLNGHGQRLQVVERKVLWMSGVAAGLGAAGGSLVQTLMGGG